MKSEFKGTPQIAKTCVRPEKLPLLLPSTFTRSSHSFPLRRQQWSDTTSRAEQDISKAFFSLTFLLCPQPLFKLQLPRNLRQRRFALPELCSILFRLNVSCLCSWSTLAKYWGHPFDFIHDKLNSVR